MRTALLSLALLAVTFLVIIGVTDLEASRGIQSDTFSEFVDRVERGEVESFEWQEESGLALLHTNARTSVRVPAISTPAGADLLGILDRKGVNVNLEPPPLAKKWLPILAMLIVPIMGIVFFYYLFIKPTSQAIPKSVIEQYNTEDRLRAAKLLLDDGKITQDEYDRLRERILSGV